MCVGFWFDASSTINLALSGPCTFSIGSTFGFDARSRGREGGSALDAREKDKSAEDVNYWRMSGG